MKLWKVTLNRTAQIPQMQAAAGPPSDKEEKVYRPHGPGYRPTAWADPTGVPTIFRDFFIFNLS
jgi:hypothetical protein